MEIKKFKTTNVDEKGNVKGGGAVGTTGGIIMSSEEGGCGLEHCTCSEGHWISIILPRTKKGVVEGITVTLSKEEMDNFLNNNNESKIIDDELEFQVGMKVILKEDPSKEYIVRVITKNSLMISNVGSTGIVSIKQKKNFEVAETKNYDQCEFLGKKKSEEVLLKSLTRVKKIRAKAKKC